MNGKDMSCVRSGDGLTVHYDGGIAQKATVSSASGKITFELRDGRVLEHNVSNHVFPEPSYLEQFGISISEDGAYFFIQSWGRGLFAFHMEDGALAWQYKLKHAHHLVARKNHVVCLFFGLCVTMIDIATGGLSARFPLSSYNAGLWPVTDDRYLVGPKRGKYFVLNEKLEIVTCIPQGAFNPKGCTTFLLRRAEFTEGGLLISGCEYFEEDNAGDMEQNSFCRIIGL